MLKFFKNKYYNFVKLTANLCYKNNMIVYKIKEKNWKSPNYGKIQFQNQLKKHKLPIVIKSWLAIGA